MCDEGIEDSKLESGELKLRPCSVPSNVHTCQTNGTFFKLSNANTTVRIFQMPNVAIRPRGSRKATATRRLILATMMVVGRAIMEAMNRLNDCNIQHTTLCKLQVHRNRRRLVRIH